MINGGMGMVPNLGTHVKTIPLIMVRFMVLQLIGGWIGSTLILGYC